MLLRRPRGAFSPFLGLAGGQLFLVSLIALGLTQLRDLVDLDLRAQAEVDFVRVWGHEVAALELSLLFRELVDYHAGSLPELREVQPVGQLRPFGSFRILQPGACLLYTSPSPRDATLSRMPSSA